MCCFFGFRDACKNFINETGKKIAFLRLHLIEIVLGALFLCWQEGASSSSRRRETLGCFTIYSYSEIKQWRPSLSQQEWFHHHLLPSYLELPLCSFGQPSNFSFPDSTHSRWNNPVLIPVGSDTVLFVGESEDSVL